MTTLKRLPEAEPQTGPIAPPRADLGKSQPLVAAIGGEARPTAPPEILPLRAESPAWPRVFPGL